jgi:hypothetical protein
MQRNFIIISLIALLLGAFLPRSIPTTTYYVSTSGSDVNNGLSPATAWQTIAKVNSSSFAAGTNILFNGGQTFSGAIVAPNAGTCVNRITFGSYGTGSATISSGSSSGFVATNLGGITVTNLIFTGIGNTPGADVTGVLFENNQAGNTKIQCVTVSNNTVSLYGRMGIEIKGSNNQSGFNQVLVSGNTVHDATGGTAQFSSCIVVRGDSGSTPSRLTHTNIIFTGNTAFNCTGNAANLTSNGNGITMHNVTTGEVSFNVAHDTGDLDRTCGGPGGIWGSSFDGVVMKYNEAYANRADYAHGACDGAAFDFDGGVINSIMEYNYAHDNQGSGFAMCQYTAAALSWSNNIFRYNISQNNDTGAPGTHGEFTMCLQQPISGLYVYNNTFYTSTSNYVINTVGGSAPTSGFFANNVFYNNHGGNYTVNIPVPGALVFTGNDWPGTNTFNWNGSTYSTFAAWQTATGQEKIAGVNVGLTSNPLFNSPGGGGTVGGYNPPNPTAYKYTATSPMAGAGLNVTTQYGVPTGPQDFYGTAIPTSRGSGYDVGAFALP